MVPETEWCPLFSGNGRNRSQLALWAALGSLQTNASTCFMGIVVTEEFPQSVAAEVGGSM